MLFVAAAWIVSSWIEDNGEAQRTPGTTNNGSSKPGSPTPSAADGSDTRLDRVRAEIAAAINDAAPLDLQSARLVAQLGDVSAAAVIRAPDAERVDLARIGAQEIYKLTVLRTARLQVLSDQLLNPSGARLLAEDDYARYDDAVHNYMRPLIASDHDLSEATMNWLAEFRGLLDLAHTRAHRGTAHVGPAPGDDKEPQVTFDDPRDQQYYDEHRDYLDRFADDVEAAGRNYEQAASSFNATFGPFAGDTKLETH